MIREYTKDFYKRTCQYMVCQSLPVYIMKIMTENIPVVFAKKITALHVSIWEVVSVIPASIRF
jgi:hypothetical protein